MVAPKTLKTIDTYIASQPAHARPVLRQVRSTIRKAMPAAEEAISYGIPAFKLHGRSVIYFAGWKEHFSLYPSTAPLVAAFKNELEPYEISKGTIRFPLAAGVPVRLIGRIAKFRAAEARERNKPKGPKKR